MYIEPKADGAIGVQVRGNDGVESMIWELDVNKSNLAVANVFNSVSIRNNLAESETICLALLTLHSL